MPEAFKDQFFSPAYIHALADAVAQAHLGFDAHHFASAVQQSPWPDLELKARMRHLSTTLQQHLALPYAEALQVLRAVVPRVQGFGNMLFPDFVECFGQAHWALSMEALELFTQHGSSEFAVRPYIAAQPEVAFEWLHRWAQHPNEHVRRLASEGSRPRLPWAMALPALKRDPAPLLPLLLRLRNDPSEYVRRSVANNLNDISKDHPELVLQLARTWLADCPDCQRLLKHALRGLLKGGHSEALALFGFEQQEADFGATLQLSASELPIGQRLQMHASWQVPGSEELKLRIEYRVHFVKKNGKTSPKIFQWTERLFAPGTQELQKWHDFQNRSIRLHQPGLHHIELVVNGHTQARQSFLLLPSQT